MAPTLTNRGFPIAQLLVSRGAVEKDQIYKRFLFGSIFDK